MLLIIYEGVCCSEISTSEFRHLLCTFILQQQCNHGSSFVSLPEFLPLFRWTDLPELGRHAI